ncbi:MAG: hypothetical protein K0R15_329 [Clostridiales bacterium]|nr:hypothetical protein [Clostridiales bacterium]
MGRRSAVLLENLEEYIEPFSRHICDIEKDYSSTLQSIENYFNKFQIAEDLKYGYMGRVWILIGKKNEESAFESLMVAQSENIYNEIITDVYYMYNEDYIKRYENDKDWKLEKEIRYNLDLIKSPQKAKINTNSNFYLYPKDQFKHKKQYLYRRLMKNYRYLKIYEIDIDVYLKPSFMFDESERNIYELAKDYYAESKLAIETNSLYWNYYKSGIGKRAFYFFKKSRER